ncbi:hypothetical protein K1719_019944 [Acacia pycnantha]|nr:hypothetical protein K1719_019944 [Acacia pycnantha]
MGRDGRKRSFGWWGRDGRKGSFGWLGDPDSRNMGGMKGPLALRKCSLVYEAERDLEILWSSDRRSRTK